ncbi:MAG: 16S rRNA (adenine(1518)-N(6)/adenine(1519)-N(6))-dimethyltransferase RsmA [Candidatus Competibacterales bacterium]|nr:16S rRNA (adenine(1518)-N(6)/adenine(1519)-N(6))-dimethyltransferase RsmA [Candidatus Competibacterales bacterium]
MAAPVARPGLRRDPALSGHRPRRRFGQHFLHDPGVIHRLVAAIDPRPGERLVEIGPGLGALTVPLLEAAGALEVIELDRDLAARLPQELAGHGSLRVHQADALAFDFAALAGSGRLRVTGNLPYNISTPLLFHLLAQAEHIIDMHFMLQKEVVSRLTAAPGTADYGRLTVMTRLRARAERLFDVGPGAFRPPPRVDSAVVRLQPHARPPVALHDPAGFAELVAQAFAQRRKTLRNSLRGYLSAAAIAAAGVDPAARPETLDLAAFAALSNLRQSSDSRER